MVEVRRIAGLAVLGMTATLAGAQTDKVKEKPPLYRYVSYWTFPRGHWADIDKDNATGNQKILAPYRQPWCLGAVGLPRLDVKSLYMKSRSVAALTFPFPTDEEDSHA